MSVEQHKTLVRRWIELWNTGDIDKIGGCVTTDYVRHDSNGPEICGPEAEQQLCAMYLAAFPDLHFTIEHLVAEDDMVLAHLAVNGTHRGELMGIPPTGNEITLTAMELYRVVDGKIAEQWVMTDALGLLQQLGAIPVAG